MLVSAVNKLNPADPFCSITSEPLTEDKKKVSSHQSQSAWNSNDSLGCLWITITTTTLRPWRGTYTKSKGLERAQPESSGLANTIFIFSSFFSQITRYPSSVSSLLWFPFQICLISRLRRPPRVLSLFHHNIQSSVALCVISAASQLACVCVRERHLIISQSYGSVPLIRLEARGKRSKLLFFWTRSSFFSISTTMDQSRRWRFHTLSQKS